MGTTRRDPDLLDDDDLDQLDEVEMEDHAPAGDDDHAAKHPIGSDDVEGRPDTVPKPATPERVKDERRRHVEENLDHGLEESFPASDPVSISPGAD